MGRVMWDYRMSFKIYKFLLDQRSKAEFEWTPYSDSGIQECISFEFLVNYNIWHVKVPLVVYVMVEMHCHTPKIGIVESGNFFVVLSEISKLES
ncbi:hypothetical protein PVK06_008119 [Gossypium arboreum]|uniref:Serine/threonine-protein phosphatase 7 long form-like protein n=1 Tax=Gossypium arboreum TaxID=29729 RepID=A0ABR0QJ54_GOSAR|nr:hypothetical protein PVK06_008119 [Gossypium arboreum]